MSNAIDLIEASALSMLLWILAHLPLDFASSLSGLLATWIGPFTKRHQVARRNLQLALPDLDITKQKEVLKGMWNNLGRTLGELAHFSEFNCYDSSGRIEVVGVEHLDRIRDDQIGGIAFSAHIGWWDLSALALNQRGLKAQMIFREENNPHVRKRILKFRSPAGVYLPKGAGTAREMLSGLKSGQHYGMLLDQKMNDGIPVPFFGYNAMTAPAAAIFAVRNSIPLLPVRCERIEGASFRITFYPPPTPVITGNRDSDVAATARKLNNIIEQWVRERPEQWMWIHNRWPDEVTL